MQQCSAVQDPLACSKLPTCTATPHLLDLLDESHIYTTLEHVTLSCVNSADIIQQYSLLGTFLQIYHRQY